MGNWKKLQHWHYWCHAFVIKVKNGHAVKSGHAKCVVWLQSVNWARGHAPKLPWCSNAFACTAGFKHREWEKSSDLKEKHPGEKKPCKGKPLALRMPDKKCQPWIHWQVIPSDPKLQKLSHWNVSTCFWTQWGKYMFWTFLKDDTSVHGNCGWTS